MEELNARFAVRFFLKKSKRFDLLKQQMQHRLQELTGKKPEQEKEKERRRSIVAGVFALLGTCALEEKPRTRGTSGKTGRGSAGLRFPETDDLRVRLLRKDILQ